MTNKISVIIIAKNAQDLIGECLDSVQFCDEIIVVDSGSTDKTRDIAREKGAKVVIYESQDFSELRNYGLKKAQNEWVLYVDTDERVTDSLRENIKYQISLRPEFTPRVHSEELRARANIQYQYIAAYRIQRKNFYLGNHEWPTVEKLERLFRKDALTGWYGELHESPKIKGKVGDLKGFLLHYTHRDLSEMLAKTIEWSEKEARFRLNAHHPPVTWWRFFRVFFTGFINSYVSQKGYKAGTVGLIESIYQGFSMFVTYARLWEMQKKLKTQNEKRKTI